MERRMVATDKLFAGSIPEIYDRFLVSLIFESYALDLARRIAKNDPRNVLETAAGTGVLTRAIASRLPAQARIVATDLNQPMLDQAAARQSGDDRIAWKQADALALPFADQSFDAVTCQFGVMFFPDKVQAYKEARRVLKPGGPPRFLERTPHGYHDVEQIRVELSAAGFTNISVDAVDEISKAPSPTHPAIAFCQETPLRNEIVTRDASRLQEATNLVTEAVARRYGSGAIEGRIRAFVVAATR
jgi:ubiquinone/menaquinone biosynthesis C-methylase UbiE